MTSQEFHDGMQHAHQSPPHDRAVVHGRGLSALAATLGTGSFAVLVGGEFLLPFAVSPYAIQNDVYMGNLFIGPVFVVVGGIGVLVGLVGLSLTRGLGRRGWWLGLRALLLAIVGAAIVALATLLFGGRFHSEGPSAPDWPPYLTIPLVGVTLVIGCAVSFLAGRVSGTGTNMGGSAQ